MRALVTGGNGFIGRYIVEQLLARGDEVRVVGRGEYPKLRALGVECVRADLAAEAPLGAALTGCDVVFHVAAKAGVWGPWLDYYRNNVSATQHILRQAVRAGVPKFVFTSSPSVVFGAESVEGADESRPYPSRYLAPYPHTKALAEQWVLRQRDILTTAIRPPLVWGPRDTNILPRIVARAKAGRLRQIGDGTNLVDVTYVENAADAHLAAADRLHAGSPLQGRAYFIGQEEPVQLWTFINTLLRLVGVREVPTKPAIPYALAHQAAALIEDGYRLTRQREEPPFTRLLVAQLANARYFDLSAARRDLGYGPRISTAEGLQRTAAAL
ncbi:MAG: NAD-dependent epimerase/dehydratase family protein [Roseiflexaceae bacterium]|nr:NAD-dependent epimerase/dehydratase family protein [Roseiflexaceae bacterium]